MDTPFVIAEACCNHMGELERAKAMIIAAKESNADYIKFQKRDIASWAVHKKSVFSAPHPNPQNAFGSTYEEHRRTLEFDISQHKELVDLCNAVGIKYACSVFDIPSAKDIIELSPSMIKIPSSCNTNYELLRFLCNNYAGDIHLSLGMISKSTINDIVNLFIEHKRASDLIIYACTSAYPLPLTETCLLEIKYLVDKYSKVVKAIGYSGHHLGIIIDIAAYTLGAKYIERHFTIDRNQKGTDQNMSVMPEELAQLISNLHDVSQCLEYKHSDVLPSEISNMEKLKW